MRKLTVTFVGVDPFAIEKGAVHPMIPDSWRYGFIQRDDGLLFCAQDNGPLVAYGALLDEIEKLKREKRAFGVRVAEAAFDKGVLACMNGGMVNITDLVEQELSK